MRRINICIFYDLNTGGNSRKNNFRDVLVQNEESQNPPTARLLGTLNLGYRHNLIGVRRFSVENARFYLCLKGTFCSFQFVLRQIELFRRPWPRRVWGPLSLGWCS